MNRYPTPRHLALGPLRMECDGCGRQTRVDDLERDWDAHRSFCPRCVEEERRRLTATDARLRRASLAVWALICFLVAALLWAISGGPEWTSAVLGLGR